MSSPDLGSASTRRSRRSSSPSDHAWNGHPLGVNGSAASAISDTCPAPAASRIAHLDRRQRPQAQRRQQPIFDGIHDAARPLAVNQPHRQPAGGQNLIRTERIVAGSGDVIGVDHVSQESAPLIPETRTEGRERPRWRWRRTVPANPSPEPRSMPAR